MTGIIWNSNLVNVVVRFIIIYELLNLEVEPYEASMLSSLCASGLIYFVTNLGSKFFKLFKSSENGSVKLFVTREQLFS